MTADIQSADALVSCLARVICVDSVPGNLQSGPLLQPFGGKIPVYPDEKNFIPAQTLYRITLKPASSLPHFTGRTVNVKLHYKEQAGKYLVRFCLFLLRKEFQSLN